MMRSVILTWIFTSTTFLLKAQDKTSLYNEGLKLKKDGKCTEALIKFEQCLKLDPEYADAYYDMGWCYNDQKNYSKAIVVLKKARASRSNYYKVNFELGWAYEKKEEYDSAIRYYSFAKETADHPNVFRQLGYSCFYKDDYTTASGYFSQYESKAKEEIKDYLYWYRKGFTQNALKNYEAAKQSLFKSASYKTDYINTWLELGFACSKLKQNDSAITYFKKAMALDPKSHIPYNGIAEVYRDNIKDMSEAMNWYKKTLDINPSERKANFGVGYCLNSLEKYNEAIDYFKKAIASERTYAAAFTELGYSNFKLGNSEEAILNLTKAIQLSPKNINSRYYLGLVYVSRKDKTNAQRMANELKELTSPLASQLQTKIDAL